MNAATTPDEVIHQSTRLKIMASLNALHGSEGIDFVELKQLLSTTDGNLGAHLTTLEKATYIKIDKQFVGKKPRTRISITREGRKAFEQHVRYLREILEAGHS
ncbi:MAG TPA: transcriptional regulator [Steroidobacteraceae bacterium]|jgi:DNA-binding MarR family transcriptional regulator|nr:transcriptional regulator [Steroidobacteraceae bacterium]